MRIKKNLLVSLLLDQIGYSLILERRVKSNQAGLSP